MNKRYTGGFRDLRRSLYEIEIYQEGYEGQESSVAFCDSPLTIEWAETDKLEPVQSGKATLRLHSDTDRQFIDLYTVRTGSIRMDVFKSKLKENSECEFEKRTLYWSGTLDPELYEEPFSYKDNYGVELTFSDFAILDRVNFSGKGFLTLRSIVQNALAASGISHGEVVEYVSTGVSNGTGATLTSDISLLADNFYDEDGIPMTWRETLEETLRPFALRLVQKAGKIVVYDLNRIHTSIIPQDVKWAGDDATLGVDKVYNNVTINFSPYHHVNLLDAKVDFDSVTEGETLDIKVNQDLRAPLTGFGLRLSENGEGIDMRKDDKKSRYFAITPIFSGSEEAGLAYVFKRYNFVNDTFTDVLNRVTEPPSSDNMLISIPVRSYIADAYTKMEYKLRISMDMMADVRYNPFETDNQEREQKNLKELCNYSYIPFRLVVRDADGQEVCHYENKEVKDNNNGFAYDYTKARWVNGPGTWQDAYLAYYEIDKDGRKENTGLLGWKTNKQCIGYCREDLPKIFNKRGNGEYINLPPKGGWLDLQIGKGLLTYEEDGKSGWKQHTKMHDKIRWLFLKSLKISLVDRNYQEVKVEDMETNAWLNVDAKEALKIDTVVGCLDRPSPTALGQVFLTSNQSVVSNFHRADESGMLEKLLIGTAYTNYSNRHELLSGAVDILHDFGTYTDNNMMEEVEIETEDGDKEKKKVKIRFILLSETQDLRNSTSEIKMARFNKDNYKGIKYK